MIIKDIPVSDLSVHRALAGMAKWEKEDPRFAALVEDIRDRGIDQPILIDSGLRVVDGRHRFWAAKDLQLPTVPTRQIPDDQVTSVILSTILQRRHYTKGQRAYITYPFFEAAHEEAIHRRYDHLKASPSPARAASTVAEFVADLGFSRELFDHAARVHSIFADDPAFAALMEPKILDEHSPVGLGAVIAGYAGRESTKKGKPDFTPTRQLELFTQTITDELTRWGYWTTADDDAKRTHFGAIRKAASTLDPQTCEEIAEYHKRLAREFSSAAKDRV